MVTKENIVIQQIKNMYMKINWKTMGIVAVSAAVLYFPALKLYQYVSKRKDEGSEDDIEDRFEPQFRKVSSPAYTGNQRSNHRHSHNELEGDNHI